MRERTASLISRAAACWMIEASQLRAGSAEGAQHYLATRSSVVSRASSRSLLFTHFDYALIAIPHNSTQTMAHVIV
jgi:hypothetical protein